MLLHADAQRITQSGLLYTKRLAHKPRHHKTEPVLTIARPPTETEQEKKQM